MDPFLAVDVEIASRTPLAICAIGAVRIEHGVEVAAFTSRVRYRGAVRFTRIHGLRRHDLADAPEWPAVWRAVVGIMAGTTRLVAYRADFDRGAILTMCGRCGIRPPTLTFTCAARIAEAHLGRAVSLVAALEALGLTFPGCHHDPLADARAAAAVVLACAGRRL